jgi:hypothetical protein
MTTKKAPRKSTKSAWLIPVIVALISLIGVCLTVIGGIVTGIIPEIFGLIRAEPGESSITFKVTDDSGTSVSQAKVVLVTDASVFTDYTDDSGVATFSIESGGGKRVFVETGRYEIYDQIIARGSQSIVEIRLRPKDVSRRSVIIRVYDSELNSPVSGAEITLISNGEVYSQASDSNGIAKFSMAFETDEIEGDVTVRYRSYNIEQQKVTLQADHVQDIRLDKADGTLAVTEIQAEPQPTPEANLPVSTSREVACIYFQDSTQAPVEILADTLGHWGYKDLRLVNGERILFVNMSSFEISQISDDTKVIATIVLTDGSSITQQLKYGDSNLYGTTERGNFSLDIRQIKRVVFTAAGSCG